ncbi:MAG: DUF1549 domain-containing protein, partial [Pirellulales bacterium]
MHEPLITRWQWRWCSYAASALLVCTSGAYRSAAADEPPSFERDVWPILAAHCAGCHGENKREAALDLRSVEALRTGGESGPALVQKRPEESLLYQRVAAGEMPPDDRKKLDDDQIAVLRDWIAAGAPAADPLRSADATVSDHDRQFWAFQPLSRPPAPAVGNPAAVQTPVDAFILSRLDAAGLALAPKAGKAALVRRAYLDLLGFPPSPEELDEFLADTSPHAFDTLVDRLLASPHFGERWGRHWLDVAGYTDTVGFDIDATQIIQSEGKWRYRDYVIRSFNEDKPYDRFITEQLAGDELADWPNAATFTPQIRELLVATGFLRTAQDFTHEPESNIPLNHYAVLHDTIEIVGSSLLGLTLNCARCHSHKFDPIPQEDYYRLMAAFTPAYNPADWKVVYPYNPQVEERALADVSPTEKAAIERHNAEIDRQVAELNARLAELRRPYEERLLEAKLAALPEPIRADTKAALQTPAEKRSEVQKYLAGKFESLRPSADEISAALGEADRTTRAEIDGEIAELNGRRRSFGKIQALFEV